MLRPLCGHLQGGKGKNTNIFTTCHEQSTVKNHIVLVKISAKSYLTVQTISLLTNLDHNLPHVHSTYITTQNHNPDNSLLLILYTCHCLTI